MLVDANLLLFAVDSESPFHDRSERWLNDVLSGPRRVGFPWAVVTAFVRVSTHPRVFEQPLTPDEACRYVDDWLECDVAWTPNPTERHGEVFHQLVLTHQLRGNLIADAQLAALAVQHGLTVYSADTDFARFSEIRWENPLAV